MIQGMKNAIISIVIALFVSGVLGCGRTSIGSHVPEGETLFDGSASYALGMNIGTSFRMEGIFPDMDEFVRGLQDTLRGEARYTIEEAMGIIHAAFTALGETRNEEIRRLESDFLAGNAQRPDIVVTASGLQYQVISLGDGPRPGPFDTVRVHYEGTLIDGTIFDSTRFMGMPVEFPLHGVIPGWTEGVQLMNVGSVFRFYIPSNLGYGSHGAGPQIPPYSTLIFEVELLDIITD